VDLLFIQAARPAMLLRIFMLNLILPFL
jgi:hypothetical protein